MRPFSGFTGHHSAAVTVQLPRPADTLVKSEPKGHQRTKIWDISPNLHCSIIGTCLTAAELRQFMVKMGETDARTATDHALHSRGVHTAGRSDTPGKLLHKTLDKRHDSFIKRFSKASTEEEVRALWLEALGQGDIPGAYWAVLTHPATGRSLVHDVFGEVHMLSHLVGRSNRLDIARLQKLQRELEERDERIARQDERLSAAANERQTLLRKIDEMDQAIIRLGARQDRKVGPKDAMSILGSVVQKLETEKARTGALAERLRTAEERHAQAEKHNAFLSEHVTELRRELSALDAALTMEYARETKPVAAAQTLLYVGGRRGLFDRLKFLACQQGYELFVHDGGIEDNLSLLPGLISQAKLALFPVDCVSHSAATLVKRLCQDEQKKFIPLRSASLASFVAAIATNDALRPGQASRLGVER